MTNAITTLHSQAALEAKVEARSMRMLSLSDQKQADKVCRLIDRAVSEAYNAGFRTGRYGRQPMTCELCRVDLPQYRPYFERCEACVAQHGDKP